MPRSGSNGLSLWLWLGISTVSAAELETLVTALEPVRQEQRFEGVIEAVNRATVSAQTSGRVVEILYDVDDYVERGDVLLKFSATEQRARQQQAQAALEEARARLQEAQNERKRIADIYAKRLVAKTVMDKADAEFKAAQARHESAMARSAEISEQLEHTVVRAPYSGIVVERHIEVGELANPGQALMTGISLEHLRVATAVPQRYVATVRGAREARIYAGDAEPVISTELTVSPYADPKAHSFRVRAQLPPGDHAGLYPGMLVKVGLQTGRIEQLMIPPQALVRRSEVTAVYVVDAQDAVHLRQVRIGEIQADGRVVILAGLVAGERVALDPVQAGLMLKEHSADAAP